MNLPVPPANSHALTVLAIGAVAFTIVAAERRRRSDKKRDASAADWAIQVAERRLRLIDGRYRPSIEEVAALVGTTTAHVRRALHPSRASVPVVPMRDVVDLLSRRAVANPFLPDCADRTLGGEATA